MAGALPMGTFLGMVAAFFTAGTVGRVAAGHEMSLSGGGMSLSAVICLSLLVACPFLLVTSPFLL